MAANITNLPTELVANITSYLNQNDFDNLRLTNFALATKCFQRIETGVKSSIVTGIHNSLNLAKLTAEMTSQMHAISIRMYGIYDVGSLPVLDCQNYNDQFFGKVLPNLPNLNRIHLYKWTFTDSHVRNLLEKVVTIPKLEFVRLQDFALERVVN
ncbi:hypothetical protein EJ08DRAFT_697237 [Tothia fuscella]|uniref:F-box domain-containing protein n=1 Tax=Tothia fuscella TaxID=1048955 RepID=A0A9P4TYD6_9PEZI|nr:hypothetical protein EJ08DRAFT_697237 [Tothia fuscella]